MQNLHLIERGIRQLEEHHNDVLDVSAATTQRIGELKQAVDEETRLLHAQADRLRKQIRDGISRAKRATVILSLLAQQDELAPLKNRVDKQPYEQYAETAWFKQQLCERP